MSTPTHTTRAIICPIEIIFLIVFVVYVANIRHFFLNYQRKKSFFFHFFVVLNYIEFGVGRGLPHSFDAYAITTLGSNAASAASTSAASTLGFLAIPIPSTMALAFFTSIFGFFSIVSIAALKSLVLVLNLS